MSELLHKVIKKTDLKPHPWHQANGWYGHIVYFEDGTKGEIYQCTEANPPSLQAGKTLTYTIDNNKYPNKYLDKPFLVTPDKIEEEKNYERQETSSSSPQSNSYNRFKGKGNGGGGWKGYGGNYENSPEIWLKKQVFISMLKLYEVLMPLVVKGEIEYKNIKKEVDEHVEHILQKSGMNNLPPAPIVQQHIPSNVHIQKPAVKHVAPSSASSSAKKSDDRTMHTSREMQSEPVMNPDTYSSDPTTDLFAEDSSMKNIPIPADILDKISKCSKKAQLTTLQRSLTEDQLKNRNIMNAFFAKKNQLGNKK